MRDYGAIRPSEFVECRSAAFTGNGMKPMLLPPQPGSGPADI